MSENTPWREDDWQARDMRLRARLDPVLNYLLSKQDDPQAVEAMAAVLFVQSCLKLDREADALAWAEEAASARKREAAAEA